LKVQTLRQHRHRRTATTTECLRPVFTPSFYPASTRLFASAAYRTNIARSALSIWSGAVDALAQERSSSGVPTWSPCALTTWMASGWCLSLRRCVLSLWWDVTVCGKVTLVILHGTGGIMSPGGMIFPDGSRPSALNHAHSVLNLTRDMSGGIHTLESQSNRRAEKYLLNLWAPTLILQPITSNPKTPHSQTANPQP